jgi:hypothetical protein
MIHHVSIPAREPEHVAQILAELMAGKCYPFGPLEEAYMAASGDQHGSMIEVYPERATLDISKGRAGVADERPRGVAPHAGDPHKRDRLVKAGLSRSQTASCSKVAGNRVNVR